MKLLNNKNLIQKIMIAVVIVLLFNFVLPTYSSAATILSLTGGVLIGPIIDLIAVVGDTVLVILQALMYGTENINFNWEGMGISAIAGGLFGTDLWMVYAYKFVENIGQYGMAVPDGEEIDITIDAKYLNLIVTDGTPSYTIPIIKYSPEKIFANQIPALDANFINPTDWGDNTTDSSGEVVEGQKNSKSITRALQETISSWYNALRNLVLVLLLSVLLYVGIRMMLTSVSSDKAKYKQMLMDWLVAVCLLFFLHYIMSFTMTFVEIITDGLYEATSINVQIIDENLESYSPYSFTTDLTGYCRLMSQSMDVGTAIAYFIMYIALVVYTVKFTWQYMKRAIKMAFLTLMAPLVTLTYPIDKMGDGKAQAFNMWLKEYIFNALLQPFHLIIYTIFLGGSMEIAVNNPVYAILFLAFITPAEKILRKFFKFDQSSDTGGSSFAGGFGGAAAFNAMKGLVNTGAKVASATSSSRGGSNSSGGSNVRQVTDPNAPDGRLDSFTRGSNSGQSAEANRGQNTEANSRTNANQYTNNAGQGNNQTQASEMQGSQMPEDLRNNEKWQELQGEQKAVDDLRADAQDDWGRNYLDGEQRKIEEEQIKLYRQTTGNQRPIRQMTTSNTRTPQTATNNGASTQRSTSAQKNTGKPKVIKGVLNVAKRAGIGTLKFGGKALAAGTIGAVGIGMGIAGDDLEDVFKYGVAGATLGYTAVPKLAKGVASGVASARKALSTAYEEGAYGKNEAVLREQDRQFISNEENREYFEEKMTDAEGNKPSRSELNETMQVAAEYNRAGISNVRQINKCMMLEKELQKEIKGSTDMTEQDMRKSAREQAMTIAKIANDVDTKDLRDQSKAQKLQDSFQRELQSKGMEAKEAEAQASRILAMVMKIKKVY